MIRFGLTACIVLACVSLTAATSGGSAAALGRAGSAILNTAGSGDVEAISCAAAGECAAGGWYNAAHSHSPAFVVSETSGRWGKAIEIPGMAALNGGRPAEVNSISCPATGECASVGWYVDGGGATQVFVVSETNGSWGNAIEVPGLAALNAGGQAYADSISCAAAGDCLVGGGYTAVHGRGHAFVVSETNGAWGNLMDVPGMATLSAGGSAWVTSVSCAAPGDCAAGGSYGRRGAYQTFIVSEANSSWGNAFEVPRTAKLNTAGNAGVSSISCAAAGECAAGGFYRTIGGPWQAFVVSETSGSWGNAIRVPGIARRHGGPFGVTSVSCAAVGECAAGGYYRGRHSRREAFVVDETNGTWGKAIEVPGTAKLNTGGIAQVDSISCAAARKCVAAGFYSGAYIPDELVGHARPFVVDEKNGTWGNAIAVPGTAMLRGDTDWSRISISCGAAGDCGAGGAVGPCCGPGQPQAFTVGEKRGRWGKANLRILPAQCVVPRVVGKPISAARKSLNAADCRSGTITNAYSNLPVGRVVDQHPRAGTTLSVAARIALTVSKGKKP